MAYTIRYTTQKGGSGMTNRPTIETARLTLIRLCRERKTAKVEFKGEVIGEVSNIDGKWNWYLDTDKK